MVKYGLELLHNEIDERVAAIKRGEKVRGGQNPVLKARLLGLRLTNLRDDREVAKGNKLDSVSTHSLSCSCKAGLTLPWRRLQYVVKRPAKQSNVIDLLSDSDDDPDILHDSEEEGDAESEEGGDFEKRAVDRLVEEAQLHAEDGHDVPDLPNAIPYQYIGGGMSYRGGWITTGDGEGEEEQDNMLESKTRSLTTQSARNAELEAGYASSDSSDTQTAADKVGGGRKRNSPSVAAGPSRKKAKKTEPSPPKQPTGLRELTCRE